VDRVGTCVGVKRRLKYAASMKDPAFLFLDEPISISTLTAAAVRQLLRATAAVVVIATSKESIPG
jgi:ABC-type multidrug transport system ATPase subunit